MRRQCFTAVNDGKCAITQRFFSAVLGFTALCGASEASARQLRWAIPAEPLRTALVSFAIQANVSISTPTAGLGEAYSSRVEGELTPEQALDRILAGTPYGFVRIDAATYRIVARDHAEQHPRGGTNLGEGSAIVVTARRRPEMLDRLPASATAIGADQLERLGARQASDVALMAAGLSFSNLGPGRDKIFLRGLSDGSFSGRTESTVGVYYDESRITYGAPDPDLSLVDAEAIEVLRGPQGALYGGGAIGGIFRIVPRAPDLEHFGGAASARIEAAEPNALGGGFSAVLNAPIQTGRLGARLVAYRDVTAGWLNNPGLGMENTNRTTRNGANLTLAARARNGWTLSARLLHQYIDSADAQYIDASRGDHVRTAHLLEPHDNDFRIASATLRGSTRYGAFTSTTSVLHHSFDSRFDATGAFTGVGVDAARVAAFDEMSSLKFITEDARLSSAAAPFPWTIGAYLSMGRVGGGEMLTVDAASTDPTAAYSSVRRDDVNEVALYGDLGYQISPALQFNAGARVYRTHLRTRASATAITPVLSDDFAGERSQIGVTPDIHLSYQPGPHAFYYARFSEGYRPGGFNSGAASVLQGGSQPLRRYALDRMWNAEIGAKLQVFDGKLRLQIAGFRQLWQKVQTDQLVVQELLFAGNVGDVQNDGFEAEAALAIADNLHLTLQVTHTNPEIETVDASFPASPESNLPGAPHFLAGASLDWRRDLGALGALEGDLALLYVGRSNITFLDASTAGIGGYLDGGLHFAWVRGDWRAGVYVENFTDQKGATFSYGNPFSFGSPNVVTPLRPRTLGLEVRRGF